MIKQSTGGGYGKPPVKNQFKKGQSGNPKGRPKTNTSDGIDISQILAGTLTVTIDGKTQEMSPFEISVRKLAQKAVAGDFRAISKFIRLCEEYNAVTPPSNKTGCGVINAPPGVDFYEWLESVTEEVLIED